MKWNSYVEFVRRNPDLKNIFDDLVDPSTRHSFETWIERQVHYIAVRPWSSLRLDSYDSHTMRFVVYCHAKNRERTEVHARYLRHSEQRGRSIGEMLKSLAAQRTDIVFDAVILIHRLGWMNGYRREAFEVFIPPKGFMP